MAHGPFRSLLVGVRQLLYPSGDCLACDEPLSPEGRDFCPGCVALLTADGHETCRRCGSSVGPHVDTANGCPRCRDSRFHFDRAFRLGPYAEPLRGVILKAKRPGGELASEALGRLWAGPMAKILAGQGVGVVIPVPLHWRRKWARGHNQTEGPGRALAEALGVPCELGCLRRCRATPVQSSRTPAGRRENVVGAFVAGRSALVRDRVALLVDDVLTTGSTCSEAARALQSLRPSRILVAVLAHG